MVMVRIRWGDIYEEHSCRFALPLRPLQPPPYIRARTAGNTAAATAAAGLHDSFRCLRVAPRGRGACADAARGARGMRRRSEESEAEACLGGVLLACALLGGEWREEPRQ